MNAQTEEPDCAGWDEAECFGNGDIVSWYSQGGIEGVLQYIMNPPDDFAYGLWADERLSLKYAGRSLIIGVRWSVCQQRHEG